MREILTPKRYRALTNEAKVLIADALFISVHCICSASPGMKSIICSYVSRVSWCLSQFLSVIEISRYMRERTHILLGWGRRHRRQPRSVNTDGLYVYKWANEPRDPTCPGRKFADIRVRAMKEDVTI
jgi:hypothetical protein